MERLNAASLVKANLKDLFKANLAPGEAYIQFQLTADLTALLSIKQVEGSAIVTADKITPMPSMPEWVIGIMSDRDRVFCVFDLAQLLNLPSQLIAPRQYQIILLKTNSEQPIFIGFAVAYIQGIVRLTAEEIKSRSDAFPEQIIPYLCGSIQQQNNFIAILEFDRIFKTLTLCGRS